MTWRAPCVSSVQCSSRPSSVAATSPFAFDADARLGSATWGSESGSAFEALPLASPRARTWPSSLCSKAYQSPPARITSEAYGCPVDHLVDHLYGLAVGLGVAVVFDAPQTLIPCSNGEFYWGGAASTAFWCDPLEDVTAVFMTQLLPSSTYPIRRELRTLVYSALMETNG